MNSCISGLLGRCQWLPLVFIYIKFIVTSFIMYSIHVVGHFLTHTVSFAFHFKNAVQLLSLYSTCLYLIIALCLILVFMS